MLNYKNCFNYKASMYGIILLYTSKLYFYRKSLQDLLFWIIPFLLDKF